MFSLIERLFSDPLWFLEYSLYRIPAVLIALVLHEWAHGYVAYRRGDPTAKMMGRLTLNPVRHFDPIGGLLLFFFGFGWARPVPVNPNYFKKPRLDDLLVSIAGVTMNFIVFLLSTLVLIFANNLLWTPEILEMMPLKDFIGFEEGLINYVIGGMGTEFAEFYARPGLLWVVRLAGQISLVNIGIAVFNLIPIPPLDGYHVLNDLVLKGSLFASRQASGIGIALVYILSFTGKLSVIMSAVISFIQGGVLRVAELVFGL